MLFRSFGNIIAMKGTLTGAVDIYHKAREYGYNDELMDARIKLFSDLQAKEHEKRDVDDEGFQFYLFVVIFFIILASPVIVGISLFIYYRRKKKRKRIKSDY